MLRWRHTTRRKYSACSQRRGARAGFAGSTAVLTGREPSSREMENDDTILACHGYEGRQESALARRFPHLVRPLLALPSRRIDPVAPREMPLAMSFECDGDHKMNDFAIAARCRPASSATIEKALLVIAVTSSKQRHS